MILKHKSLVLLVGSLYLLTAGLFAQEANKKQEGITKKEAQKIADKAIAKAEKDKKGTVITGLVRARGESKINYGFVEKVNDADFISSKAQIGINHYKDNWNYLRVNFQYAGIWGGQNGDATGLSTSSDADVSKVDVREAYVNTGSKSLWLRIGRQKLVFGDQRILGGLDWTNIGRSHDGIRLTHKTKKNQLNVFSTIKTERNSNDLLNDSVNNSTSITNADSFSGIYDTVKISKALHIEPYLLANISTTDPKDENGAKRFTFGTRITNKTKKNKVAKGTKYDYALEGAYQFGSVTKKVSIGAWATALAAGYKVNSMRFGAEFAMASGDDDASDDKVATFANLYHTNHIHYGQADFISWQNMIAGSVNFTYYIGKKAKVKLAYWNIMKQTENDAWYNVKGGSNTMNPALVKAKGTALFHEIDLTGKYKFSMLTADFGASILLAGNDIAVKDAKTPIYLFLGSTSKF